MSKDSVSDWDTTAANNTDVAGVNISATGNVSQGDDGLRTIMAQIAAYTRRGSDLASASTLDLDSIDSLLLNVTGTTTVTAVTLTSGHWRIVRATGAFQMTASASLIVNGSTSVNYTTAAEDFLLFEGYGSSVVRASLLSTKAALAAIAALAVTDGNIIVGNGTTWVAESGATARTSLGLGTGDSPQFTSIQLGDASDTTIARSGAGVVRLRTSRLH